MYNQQAVYIEILRSQSDISHVSILFQLYDLPETSIDNGYGAICLSVVYKRALYMICLRTLYRTNASALSIFSAFTINFQKSRAIFRMRAPYN